MHPAPANRPTRRLSLKQGGLRWWGRIGRICRSPRALTRMLRLTPMGVAVAAVSGLPAISVWAQAAGNVIKPDGRTSTTQQIIGTRTDISTGTVRGDNAFNSFSRFEIGQGQTVNVIVPAQAQRVVNLVTEAPIRIDGVLNGLKDGSLNGKLVFADPYGMVVSKSGVVNVGSLQVSAPTPAHMDALMNAQGQIGDAAAEQLLQGQAPRAKDGLVRIDGRIHALERVAIQANRIEITGSIRAGADAAHEAAFRSAVNANGLSSAVGLVERGGVIELVGDETLLVSGSLVAAQGTPAAADTTSPAGTGLGGQVRLQGSDITLQATALIDVSGAYGGGSAILGDMQGQRLPVGTPAAAAAAGDAVGAAAATPLTQSLVIAPGARVLADATDSGDGGRVQFLSDDSLDFGGLAGARGGAMRGNGGFVEVSGRRRLQLQGLVDTTAAKGKTGTLLIDPDDLCIFDGSNGTVSTVTLQTLAASTNLLLEATNTITLGDSAGHAVALNLSDVYLTPDQSITLLSRDISFNAGSLLLTGGGSVNLLAVGDAAASQWFGSGGVYRYDVSKGFDAALKAGDVLAGGTIHLNPAAMIITRGVSVPIPIGGPVVVPVPGPIAVPIPATDPFNCAVFYCPVNPVSPIPPFVFDPTTPPFTGGVLVPAADPASAALLRNAGNITLRGKTLLLDAGASLLAHATGSDGFKGGQVELSAYAIDQNGLLKAEARAGLVLAGTVRADAITVNVVARAESLPDSPYGIGASDADYLRDLGEFAGALLGVKAVYQEAQADATLLLTGQAVLAAATDISLNAVSANKAAAAVFVMTAYNGTQGSNLAAAAAAAQVKTSGVADVRVQGGATLTAGGTLTLLALNDATAKSSVKVLSNTATAGAALSLVQADVQANVHVDAGALVTAGRLDMQALQTGNMRNIASSTLTDAVDRDGKPTAAIGASVAISDIQASSVARLDANLRNVGDVTLVADTSLWQNYTAARNMTGKAELLDQVQLANPALVLAFEPLATKLGDFVGDRLFATFPKAPQLPLKGAAVLSLNQTDLQSEAVIGSNVTISSNGNVAVLAQTEDRAIHNIATTEVASKDVSQGAGANSNLAAAVAVGLYKHDARAVIKNDTRINAQHVGLQSQVYQPLDITWLSLENASPEDLVQHLTPPAFGTPQYVFSSWASANAVQSGPGAATALASAGSVNWTQFTNNSISAIEPGARIEVIGADQAWQISWNLPKAPGLDGDTWGAGVAFPGVSNMLVATQDALEGLQALAQNGVGELTGLIGGKAPQIDVTLKNAAQFSKAVDMQARGESAFVTLAGQPAGLDLFGKGGGTSIGGSFNHAGAEHTTLALVADGVTLSALRGSVRVDADSRDLVIAITPSAGKGQGAVANLIGAFADLNNTTQAQLRSTDTVTAQALVLQAREDLSVWSAAGSAGFSSGSSSVGVALAANRLAGSTLAAIVPGQGQQGVLTVDSVLVQATSQGTGAALSASAAAVDNSADDPSTGSGSGSSLNDTWTRFTAATDQPRKFLGAALYYDAGLTQALDFVDLKTNPPAPAAAPAASGLAVSTAAVSAAATAPVVTAVAAPVPAAPPTFSLAGAGSSSVSIGQLDTRALVQGARIEVGHGAGNSVNVRASDDTQQYALSGSIALLKLNSASWGKGAGVSGAIAIDVETNSTRAQLIDSSILGMSQVSVEALSAGQRIAAGLALAGSQGGTKSYLLDGSYSIIDVGNTTLAGIEGGSIEGRSAAAATAVEVLAYDATQTGAGAGALTVQLDRGGAAGAAVAVALTHNAVDAHLLGADLGRVGDVDVRAFDPVTVGLGAASLGISTSTKSGTLEGSITYAELASTTSARIGTRLTTRHDTKIDSSGQVVVQASDAVAPALASRFEAELASDGRPAADANLDFGAALRAGEQESFGGQSIGRSQPGALVIAVAGGIAAGAAKGAVGAAAAVTQLRNVHAATLAGADVKAADVRVDASDATLVVDVALGVAAQDSEGSRYGAAGSVAVTQDDSRSSALLGDAGSITRVTTSGAVQVQATAQEKAFAVAGALAVSSQGTSAGMAAVYSEASHVTEALLRDPSTRVSAGTDVTVGASAASQHIGVAAGVVGVADGKAGLSASLVLQDVSDRVSATLSDARVGAQTLTVQAGDLADQPTQVYSGAGSIGFSSKLQGGAAITDNQVALQYLASVSRGILDLTGAATSLQVQADNAASIIGVTLAGGGSSGSAALNGAASANSVADRSAALVEATQINSAGDVVVAARDRSRIDIGTGALALGDSAAGAAAVAVTRIDNQVSALLQGTDSTGRGSPARLRAANLIVSASSDASVVNAAAGVGSGQSLGGAGSVAVNLIDTEVNAHIGRGAVVALSGSVAVLASRSDDIQAFGGALGLSTEVGVGLSATVNLLQGSTRASIGADGEAAVTLDAQGAGSGLQVNSGVLTQALPGLAQAGTQPQGFDGLAALTAYDATRAPMREGSTTVHGVAVNASSIAQVLSYDASAGVSQNGLGVGGVTGAHVIQAKTLAEIAHAQINQAAPTASTAPDAAQTVEVKASSHDVMTTLALGAAAGGGAGGGAMGSDAFLTDTQARLRNATVRAQQDLRVQAGNEAAQSAILIGVSGGTHAALAGSVGVEVFEGSVQAAILDSQTRSGRDTTVLADNTAVLNVIAGAGGVGGEVGLGGAVSLMLSNTQTSALIGRQDAAAAATRVSTGGDLRVQADSSSAINSLTVAGAGGDAAAGAAIAAVAVITSSTTAAVSGGAVLDVGVDDNWVRLVPDSGSSTGLATDDGSLPVTVHDDPTGKLSVTASDHGAAAQNSGAIGLGFTGGIGGTVSVLVARAHVTASLNGNQIDAGSVALQATNQQQDQAATVGVGVGTDLGAGFALSLMMLGTGSPDAEAFGAGNKGGVVMTAANKTSQADHLGAASTVLGASDSSRLNQASQRDISGALHDAGSNSAAATIHGSDLRITGDVTVQSDQRSAQTNLAGAVGLAGEGVGVGGSVGISILHNASVADVHGGSLTAGGSLLVQATAGDAGGHKSLDLLSFAGALGYGGLGATVGIGWLDNTASAQADGLLAAQDVQVQSQNSGTAKVENVVVAAGDLVAGAAVSDLRRTGTVDAWVNRSGAAGNQLTAPSLGVNATDAGSAQAISVAAAAGIGVAASGAAATLNDRMAIHAGIGDNSQITVSGGSEVQAQRAANLDGRAWGVGVAGGVQIGASVAVVSLGGETTAQVGRNVGFHGAGGLTVLAEEGSGNALQARSAASGGGYTAALDASVATAENTATVSARIGDGSLLPDADVSLVASHNASQQADASGVTVSGMLALGAAVAQASSSATTLATLGHVQTSSARLGDLRVVADGSDQTVARAMAGGGGLVSGQAAVARANDTSRTGSEIADWATATQADAPSYTVQAGALNLAASHQAGLRSEADTINASVVGGSGAVATSTADNQVSATIGHDAQLRALALGVNTLNQVHEIEGGDNAAGAGGGLANGSAVQATTRFTTASTVSVGERAGLTVFGDPTDPLAGRLVLTANTDVASNTAGSLNTGGLIDVPYADVQATSDARNTVSIGANATLHSVGDLVLGTTAINQMQASSLVKTYGGVSAAGGTSKAGANQTDRISLGKYSLLQAYGNVLLQTGRDADGGLNEVQAQANTDVYNYTALPITTTNKATANSVVNAALDLGTGSQIQAGRSVYLRSFEGDTTAHASGEGHNPYLELLSQSTHDSHAHDQFTGSIALDGAVTAGYYRRREISIAADGQSVRQTTDQPELQLPVLTFFVDAAGNYHQDNAQGALVDARLALRPQGYIARIDGFNPSLYYDDKTKASFGNVPNAAIGAYALPDLFAAGGSIEVNASSVSGNGHLVAQGGPLLQVLNASNRTLVVNKLVMPDEDSGGAVNFLGLGGKPASLQVSEVNKGRLAAISLHNSFNADFGGLAADIVLQGDAAGVPTVRTPRGSFTMVNDFGNVLSGTYDALTVEISVPKGTFEVDSNGYYSVAGSPQTNWAAVAANYRPNDIDGFVDTAAYAWYRQNIGSSTDLRTYATDLNGLTRNADGSYRTGYLFNGLSNHRYDSSPGGNYVSWYGGHFRFELLPTEPLTHSGADTNTATTSKLTANRVDISAKYLDVNAPILAGSARDVNVTINNTKLYADHRSTNFLQPAAKSFSFFECVLSPKCLSFNGLKAEANGQYKVPEASLTFGANSPHTTVMFDKASGHVSTANIGSTATGSVSLSGMLLNSNALGSSKIELSSGAITVNLNNQSGYVMDLPLIAAGSSGSEGVIRITDTGQTVAGKPLTTWYVSGDGGATVAMYQSRTATSYEGLTPISGTSSLNGASTSSYLPEKGLAYDWTMSATATRRMVNADRAKWGEVGVTAWEFANGLTTPRWTITPAGGTVKVSNPTANYTTDLRVGQVDFWGTLVDYTNNAGKDKQTHPWQVATSITLLQHNTVKADHGIGIRFKGYTDGGVTIASNATTYLGKTITNAGGHTSVTVSKGDLIGQQGGLLAARNLDLAVAAGRLGGDTETQALAVLQDAGGKVNASAGGDLAIQSLGALTLGTVKAGTLGPIAGVPAQLTLQALGDITAASAATVVSGYNVSLTSQNGRIGGATADAPLALNLITLQPANAGAPTLPVLTAEAHGDVNLKLTGGDVRIDSIQAADGNVTLTTTGSLYDNKAGQGAEGRDANSLLTLWQDKLHLTDASGDRTAAVADMLLHTIAPLDQQANRDYQAYWALQALGTAAQGGGSLTLTAAGLQALRAQAAARFVDTQVSDAQVNAYANELLAGYGKTFVSLLGSDWQGRAEFLTRQTDYRFSADRYNEYWQLQKAVAGQLTLAGLQQVRAIAATVLGGAPSDAQLQAYVDQRLSDLGRDFAVTLGSSWAAQAGFKSYDPGYQFAPDQALLKVYATGNYWDLAMLQNSVRAVALEAGGGASSGNFDHLNIVGRKVSLVSSGATAALGQSDGLLSLTLGAALSDAVKLALSQASAPGDVQTVVDSTGKVTGLTVKNNRPIFLQASGPFDATFKGQIAVQAQDRLQVGTVSSLGAVRLSSQDGIGMAVPGAGLIQGATLVLDGGAGSLGSLSPDLSVQALLIQTPELSLARADGNLFLSQATGNLLFDVVTGGQSVELRAAQGGLAQKQPGLLSLVGQDVRLVAFGDIGGAGAAALNAQVNGGELTLAGQNVWLKAGSGAGARGFKLGSSTVKAKLALATLGNSGLTLSGDSTVAGQATLAVGGALTSLAGSSLAVGGGLALSADAAAFEALQVTGNADLQVSKALKISGLGQFDADLSGHAASMSFGTLRVGGRMLLVTPVAAAKPAATGLAHALSVDGEVPEAALGSVQIGSLDVGGDADISAGGLLALRGNVTVGGGLTVSATESLSLQDLQVGQGLSLQAGTVLSAERVSAGGNAQMNSGGTLTLASLSATVVKLDAVRDMQLDLLSATHADLSTATQIALREGRIADTISLRADKVQAGLVSSAGDGMVTELTGFQGQRASTVVVTMDTPSAWQMPVLNAVNAQLATNGSATQIVVASIGAGLSLSTPDGVVAMNNQAQGLSGGAAVQLFTPTQDFTLVRDGKQLDTSATLVAQRADQTVAAPRLFTPVDSQILASPLALSGQGLGGDGVRYLGSAAGNPAAWNGPLAALFPQLRRLANGQWDFEALRRENPLSRQPEAVGDLEF